MFQHEKAQLFAYEDYEISRYFADCDDCGRYYLSDSSACQHSGGEAGQMLERWSPSPSDKIVSSSIHSVQNTEPKLAPFFRFINVSRFFNATKQPAPDKRKPTYAIGTPLVKRELEHRLSVANILRDLNLAKYIGIFNDEEINFEVFLTLSEKDLHDIGIDCQRDIELILGKVAEYNMNNSGGIDF